MHKQLKVAKRQAGSSTTEDSTLEEDAYQRGLVEWPQDHGELGPDKSLDGSADSPNDDDNDQMENYHVMECFASTAQT